MDKKILLCFISLWLLLILFIFAIGCSKQEFTYNKEFSYNNITKNITQNNNASKTNTTKNNITNTNITQTNTSFVNVTQEKIQEKIPEFENVSACMNTKEFLQYVNGTICSADNEICSNYCETAIDDWIRIEFFFRNDFNRTLTKLQLVPDCKIGERKIQAYGGLWQLTEISQLSYAPKARRYITEIFPEGYFSYLYIFKPKEIFLNNSTSEIIDCNIKYNENLMTPIREDNFRLKVKRT